MQSRGVPMTCHVICVTYLLFMQVSHTCAVKQKNTTLSGDVSHDFKNEFGKLYPFKAVFCMLTIFDARRKATSFIYLFRSKVYKYLTHILKLQLNY